MPDIYSDRLSMLGSLHEEQVGRLHFQPTPLRIPNPQGSEEVFKSKVSMRADGENIRLPEVDVEPSVPA